MEINEDTPITWGTMKAALERAWREADGEGSDHHAAIAMDTVAMGFARLEGALEAELGKTAA